MVLQVTLCAAAIYRSQNSDELQQHLRRYGEDLDGVQSFPSASNSFSFGSTSPATVIACKKDVKYRSPCTKHVMHGKRVHSFIVKFDLRVWLKNKSETKRSRKRAVERRSTCFGLGDTRTAKTAASSRKPEEDRARFHPGRAPVVRLEVFGSCKRALGAGDQTLRKLHATLWPHEATCMQCARGGACMHESDDTSKRAHVLVLAHAVDLQDPVRCNGISEYVLGLCRLQREPEEENCDNKVVVTFSESVPKPCWAGLPIDSGEKSSSVEQEGASIVSL